MTETQKRIKAYRAALPGLKERVAAVALLLVMSVVMMTSATFAWLTISRRPAVTGVNTSVAANGNLEIALATSAEKPDESKVGDSSAADGKSVTAANITWGNLVNLSDPSYGLDGMTLRPAWLNESSLLVSPLYGAVYQGDGRVSQLNSNFAYTVWDADTEKFLVTDSMDELGVRAISSTKLEVVEGQEEAKIKYEMRGVAESANLDAGVAYLAITNNKAYMNSLANIMGVFMTARMNSGQGDESLTNPSMDQADVQNLRNIFADFVDAYDLQFKAWAELANYKLFLIDGSSYNKKTAEYMKTATKTALNSEGILFQGWETAISDYAKLVDGLEKLEVLSAQGSVKWADSGLDKIVNSLMNIGTCTVEGTPINNIGASNATSYLGKTNEAKITNGVLFNFEQINGAKCDVRDLSISATVKRAGITVPASVSANISTTAATPFHFPADLAKVDESNTGGKLAQTANDTYGLAIDLWVRTNAESSYLTLEGNVMTEVEEDVPVMGTDSSGNQVNIYTLTRKATETAEDGTTSEISYTEELYKKETEAEDGTVTATWYDAETHTVFALEEGEEPRQKVEDVTTVVGYEGENRIWQNNQLLTADSTTQGSGSCYVYYADTPEDQARSLKLLEAFNVAFVDDTGKLLAEAVMDTERHYAANGRVTVPLVLSPGSSINLGEDAQGNVTYAITALEKNVATRITAIVYLDGTKLTNQEVLAAADIQGQLNIQFGSNDNLAPIGNEELENKERRVSASVDVANFDYDKATGPMTTNVTVHVDGDEPNTVTAFFLRAISSTQGSREKVMTFTKNDAGDWVSSYTFTSPGKYILRTVQLDGVDYDLETPPEVNVTGFAVESLSCTEATGSNHVKILTAADSSTVNLQLKFAADDVSKMPSTVQGRFLRDEDGSAVNVNFTYNATTGLWNGTATFLTSGNYTLQYLLLDGRYAELDSGLWQTADVTLGMRVAVYTTSPHSFKFLGENMADNEKLLGMQVKIVDNEGEEMLNLPDAKLTYVAGVKKMDTDLTWDGNYYVGELTTTGPGIWRFSQVDVGSNTLTTATTSPTFTIQSPEPPEYHAHVTTAYQYKPDPKSDPAVMNAQITNSMAAEKVYARIVNTGSSDTEGTWVKGNQGTEFTTTEGKSCHNWSFTVPKDANGYQDGNWQMLEIKMCDVYAADGTAYTEENPLVFDVSNENNVTKVVNRVNVTFATDKSQNFGMTGDEVTAQFMTEYTISGLDVSITDIEGKAIQGVSDVQMKFIYDNGTSKSYGGYTNDSLSNGTMSIDSAAITVTLDRDSDPEKSMHYIQSDPVTILYAGSYSTKLSFMVGTKTYTYVGNADDAANNTKALPDKAPRFTVSSKAPTMTISNVSTLPAGARFFSTATPSSKDHVVTGLKNWKSENGYSASVFIYTEAPSGPADSELVTLKYPSITLKIADLPKAHSGVTVVVPNGSNDSQRNEFTFAAGEMQKSGSIGAGQNGKIDYGLGGASISSWPKLYPVGKQQIKTIDVTYGGMDFVMTLSHPVNISQTLVPPYANLVIDESTYSGATRIYSEDTENVVLRKMSWSQNGIQTGDDATIGAWSSRTLHTDYGQRTWKWWYFSGENYLPFYWTEFSRTVKGTQTPYTTTYTINTWIVNGQEYDVSKNPVSFKVTNSIEAEAIVTVETVYGDTTETETIEVKYGYLKGSEKSGNGSNNVDGKQIGSVVDTEDGNYQDPTIGIANTDTGANMYDDKNKYLECDNRAS